MADPLCRLLPGQEGRRRRGGRESSRSLGADSFLLVVDVPVIMPQIQFIHRRLFFQLWRRDKYPQCMLYSSRCNSWTRFLTCPGCCFDKCLLRWCRKLWSFRSCSSSLFVDIPFVPQTQILMVCSADHRVSTVAVLSWWSMFLLAVVHILRCCLCEDSRDPTVAARARICRYGLRLCFHSPWFWCVCVRIRRYELRLCFPSAWFWCSCVCVRLRRRGQGLRSCSPWFGARVHSCRGAETAPLVCLFS